LITVEVVAVEFDPSLVFFGVGSDRLDVYRAGVGIGVDIDEHDIVAVSASGDVVHGVAVIETALNEAFDVDVVRY
jgi:hypothetical protein